VSMPFYVPPSRSLQRPGGLRRKGSPGPEPWHGVRRRDRPGEPRTLGDPPQGRGDLTTASGSPGSARHEFECSRSPGSATPTSGLPVLPGGRHRPVATGPTATPRRGRSSPRDEAYEVEILVAKGREQKGSPNECSTSSTTGTLWTSTGSRPRRSGRRPSATPEGRLHRRPRHGGGHPAGAKSSVPRFPGDRRDQVEVATPRTGASQAEVPPPGGDGAAALRPARA